jgi:halimadienyl-diphosphate synthase
VDPKLKAKELVQNLDGRIGPSPYDIAWMARVPASDGQGPRWPELTDWLLEHQWLDGSWGSIIHYYHDRILCTLAAIIALREHGSNDEGSFRAIELGERYIWNHLHFLRQDPIELAGFELLLPTLLIEARTLNLAVPSHSCGYGRIRAAKLKLVPPDLIYSPSISITFSLEFMGDQVDTDRLQSVQAQNGSIANSPATTAFLVLKAGNNDRALDYLESMRALPGGIPAFHPYRTYETAWVLEHLAFGDLPLDELVEPSVWETLLSDLESDGVGIDPTYSIKDGDTTSVTLHVLALGGQPVDPMILHHFEKQNTFTFRTFAFERNASVTTNAHALEALSFMPEYPNRDEVRNHIMAMLLADRRYESYWIDKWHASPYYATAHVLISLIDNGTESIVSHCTGSADWLLHTQRDDGSWGYFNRGTIEETAYALMALLHFHRQVAPVDAEILRKGMSYLYRESQAKIIVYPEMWISKTLSASESIIEAAILAAINLYQETFGRTQD